MATAITTRDYEGLSDEEGDELDRWRTLKHDGGLIRLHEFVVSALQVQARIVMSLRCHVFVYDTD